MPQYRHEHLTKRAFPIVDTFLSELKETWAYGAWPSYNSEQFLPLGIEWFKSTKLNSLIGWDEFEYADVIMGCTHYIESIIIKHGWSGFQILPHEYAYFGLMGKHGTEPGNLQPNVPLLVSLPNYRYADLRPEWDSILRECETKNIDIHIDFAWLTTAKDIEIDLTHPRIQSFAMSMSKYNMHWNRVGVRWCRQRTMDSITMFNHYYEDVNSAITTCGAFMVQHIPRDYTWNTYHDQHFDLCNQLDLTPTKITHVALDENNQPIGIGQALVKAKENV